jgi:hypothetical protein
MLIGGAANQGLWLQLVMRSARFGELGRVWLNLKLAGYVVSRVIVLLSAYVARALRHKGMKVKNFEVVDGELAGAWIKAGLGGRFGAVTLQVPEGFAAYARIFHPARDIDRNPVRWTDVARALGTRAHREMQWHAILGLCGPEELQDSYGADSAIGKKGIGSDPVPGEMDIEEMDALCKILASHTVDKAHCFFGLSVIQNWLDAFSADELRPLLRLPLDRDYVVLCGPLSAIPEITFTPYGRRPTRKGDPSPSEAKNPEGGRRRPPNLIWPSEHGWLVVSEVDFDSTLVGGSMELISAIVDSTDLEAWPVKPTDSLAWDADKVNRPERS